MPALNLRMTKSLGVIPAFSMFITIEEKDFSREFIATVVSLSINLATSMQSKHTVSLIVNETKIL